MSAQKILPSFKAPPVSEVVLSVQFDELTELKTPQIGLLWQKFQNKFPVTQDQPLLEPVIERLDPGGEPQQEIHIELVRRARPPRVWFLNREGTELLQIQQDRFIRNWRKTSEDNEYPRYEKHLRPSFIADYRSFEAFLDRERIGRISPNQCEVTYVNEIESGGGWNTHSELGKIITVFRSQFSDSFLSAPEDAAVHLRFLIRRGDEPPRGRLHVSIKPAYRNRDGKELYVMTLTARGKPFGDDLEGVMKFFDLGREWVVRGFAAITTNEMHDVWGRLS